MAKCQKTGGLKMKKHKIVYTFRVNNNRYGVSISVNTVPIAGVIEAFVCRDTLSQQKESLSQTNWVHSSVIYGHKINCGEKIVYVGGTESPEYFNAITSEAKAAEIHAISWLESLEYSQILEYSSMLETEE